MPYLDDEAIEKLASELRKRLGVYDMRILDGMTLIFKAIKAGVIQGYKRVNDWELEGDLAQYDPASKIITISESTIIGSNRREPRAIFTIAHELAHAWLGHSALRARANSSEYLKTSHGSLLRDEFEANRLAATFLAPLHLAGNPLEQTVEEIARRFFISFQAAEIRKPILDRIYRRLHNILRPLPSFVEDFLRGNKGKGR